MNKSEIINEVKRNVERSYIALRADLASASQTRRTEGETRRDAGKLVEAVLQTIFDTINKHMEENKIASLVGKSDCLSKDSFEYQDNIYSMSSIQVDRHVWYCNRRIAFIENKTYLDSCYYDRALADFRKIVQSLKQSGGDPADVSYIVFAGQKAAKENTLLAYEADFWHDTKGLTNNPNGIVPQVFYFLQGTRNSKKPMYKYEHLLNFCDIERFASLIFDLLS